MASFSLVLKVRFQNYDLTNVHANYLKLITF